MREDEGCEGMKCEGIVGKGEKRRSDDRNGNKSINESAHELRNRWANDSR